MARDVGHQPARGRDDSLGVDPCLIDPLANDECGAEGLGAGPCAEGPPCDLLDADLAGLGDLDPDDRVRVLASITARFCATYLRWMRSPPGDALTFSSIRVLEVLDNGGPAIMREIAARLGLTARNLTAIVDSLEHAGLVRRVPHPHDRRATVIELTALGREEGTSAKARAVERAATAFDSLSPEDQERYARLLSQLSAGFCR